MPDHLHILESLPGSRVLETDGIFVFIEIPSKHRKKVFADVTTQLQKASGLVEGAF